MTAGAATCADVAVVQGLLSLDLTHWPAFFPLIVLCGGLAGLLVNFTLSRRFVFASDNRSAPRQLLTFSLVALTTIGLRLVVAYALMALLTLPLFAPIGLLPIAAPFERVAHLGAVGLVTIYSFLAHKHVTFAGGLLQRLAGRAAPMVH
ncbi:MAG: hypothetical protein ABS76_02805 [Pelagibacterium sp. SCN 64-44]|nr:MAG: hypothetical protein ABS76_02805 [Pelagibacterium sp. SCN 64-44]